MKITKKFLLPVIKALSFDMTLKEGRIARDFRKQMAERYNELDADRIALAEKFCNKDEEGKSEMTPEGNFKFDKENLDTFLKEVNELTAEVIEIDGDQDVLVGLLEKTEAKLSPEDITLVDDFIASLEK